MARRPQARPPREPAGLPRGAEAAAGEAFVCLDVLGAGAVHHLVRREDRGAGPILLAAQEDIVVVLGDESDDGVALVPVGSALDQVRERERLLRRRRPAVRRGSEDRRGRVSARVSMPGPWFFFF